METLQQLIRRKREKRNLTLEQASKELGTSFGYLWRMESNDHEISDKMLKKMAKLYKVSFAKLILLKYQKEFLKKEPEIITHYEKLVDSFSFKVNKDKGMKENIKKGIKKELA